MPSRRHAGSGVVLALAVLIMMTVLALGSTIGMPTGPTGPEPLPPPRPPDAKHIYVIPKSQPKPVPAATPVPQRYGPAPPVVPVPDPTSTSPGRYEAFRQAPK